MKARERERERERQSVWRRIWLVCRPATLSPNIWPNIRFLCDTQSLDLSSGGYPRLTPPHPTPCHASPLRSQIQRIKVLQQTNKQQKCVVAAAREWLCSHHLLSNPTKPDNDNDGEHFVFFYYFYYFYYTWTKKILPFNYYLQLLKISLT